MKIDIKIIVTVIYLVYNFINYKNQETGYYLLDISWTFKLFISTIIYLLFWIVYLIF